MSTTMTERSTTGSTTTAVGLRTGDVIEIEIGGEMASAMVLLASGDAVILDACDGSTPFVARLGDLGDVRVFDPHCA